MGLNVNSVKLLFEAKASGVSFARTLTLGKQSFACPGVFLAEMALKYGHARPKIAAADWGMSFSTDDFLRMLGATETVAIDHSAYEGAELIHDMNLPIPHEHCSRFDVVFDGGSLEHIFNFPAAIKNCMDMVRLAGHLVLITPINNYCGHGFYQFSPELFFRTLCRENGFLIERAIAWEECGNPDFFLVKDPESMKQRVEMISDLPILMFVQAKKLEHVKHLAVPQQSDYVPLWAAQPTAPVNPLPVAEGRWQGFKKGLCQIWFTRFPHRTNAWFGIRQRMNLKKLHLRKSPGFVRLGKLSSSDPTDRLAPMP
jgi:SAM-dependent methyltransferase